MKLGRETLKAGRLQRDCCYAVGFYNRFPTALLSAAAISLSPPSRVPLCLTRVSSGFAFVCEHCGFCIMFAAYW